MTRSRAIAITGGIGSGKSTVIGYLADKGYCVLDCDKIAREISDWAEVVKDVACEFGEGFIENGRIRRRELANYVFADSSRTERLNRIFHPRIMRIVAERAKQCGDVFVEAATLFEGGLQDNFDECWLVVSTESKRINRVEERDGLELDEISLRIARQLPDSVKIPLANVILINDGEKRTLYEQIDRELLRLGH